MIDQPQPDDFVRPRIHKRLQLPEINTLAKQLAKETGMNVSPVDAIMYAVKFTLKNRADAEKNNA